MVKKLLELLSGKTRRNKNVKEKNYLVFPVKVFKGFCSMLHFKIIVGYLIQVITIVIMVCIFISGWMQVELIESTNMDVQQIRKYIYTIHGEIISLSLNAEAVICWDDQDCERYRFRRLSLDSTLQTVHLKYMDFVNISQIDTLRYLLSEKEKNLFRIVGILKKQAQTDSLLVHELPNLTNQVVHTPVISSSKKRFLGIFPKKEKSAKGQSASIQQLYALSERLIRRSQSRERYLALYTDSLAEQNCLLNHQLHQLIVDLDRQASQSLRQREDRIATMNEDSLRLIACVLIISILLSVIFNILIHKELKEQKRVREMLETSNARNESLLHNQDNLMITLTHDLRAPLNIIHGYAELICKRRGKREDCENASQISQSAKEMLLLINRLLEHYRIDKGKEEVQQTAFPLSVLTDQIGKNYQNETRRKYLDMYVVCPHPEIIIISDRMRIQEIINNLLTNAVKFTSEGFIRIELFHQNDTLYIKVEDSGSGMNEEEKRTIFDMFKRLENSVSKAGYGIGLPITAAQVKLLGGRIDVDSTPGVGSLFTVTIPALCVENEVSKADRSIPSISCPPVRVLAIDDDPIQLRFLADLLEDTPVKCDTCVSIKEMFSLLKKNQYQLILTDIQMAPVSGIDMIRLLRDSNLPQSQNILVIAVTARTDQKLETYLKHGFAGYLNKPFSQKELLEIICQHIPKGNSHFHADFSSLLGKEKEPARMLELFIKQTEKQVELLRRNLEKDDAAGTANIIHCIASYWSCIRTDLNKADLELLALMEPGRIPVEYKPIINNFIQIGMELIQDATILYQIYGKENINSGG